MAISDEDALKVGRKVLRMMRSSAKTRTLLNTDLAVAPIKVKVPAPLLGGTFSTGFSKGDPVEINADPTDSGISDSD